MKPRKNTILILLLGLLLVAFAAVTAQTPAQGEQKKNAEACCSMESCCCCSGDSCKMHDAGTVAAADTTAKTDAKAKHDCCSGDSCKTKKKADMNHSEDHECCGCCADSCDMKMKHDATMKHDPTMKHDMKGHKSGDCCKAKAKTTKKAA